MAIRSITLAGLLHLGLTAMALAVGAGGPVLAQESGSIAAQPHYEREEYERVSRDMKISAERLNSLVGDIAGVKKDYASITAALIQAAKTEKKLSLDIEDISGRLDALKKEEAEIRASLNARRGVLAEVLGGLERMGLNPPPAIFVKPEDALSSVRSAILLGAVVPELRQETEVLIADVRERQRVSASTEDERAKLVASVGEQLTEKQRLNMLLDEKKKFQAETLGQIAAEQQRSQDLAAKAGSLKDLIASLDRKADSEKAVAQAARAAQDDRARRDAEAAALPENNQVMLSPPFSALEGQIATPVTGRFLRRFGGKDDNGGVMQGDILATQSGAIVTAPADGNILYAGPFRSYGQLLILDAGNGYHVVLAGMSRISVALGQSVLAGEPVGAMQEARVASASAKQATNGPELYVEFRKDGKPVDPSPWWAERLSGRTGNDT